MAQAMHGQSSPPPISLFSTDGRPHPVQDTLMVVTLVLGAVRSSLRSSTICTCSAPGPG